jgi:hypothetical protein
MILIDLDDKKIWNKALENEEHLIGHSWDYSKFLSINDKNLKPHLLIFDEINIKNFCAVNIGSYKDFRYMHSLNGYTGYSQFFLKDDILKIKKVLKNKNFITYYFVTNQIFLNKNIIKNNLNNYYDNKNNLYLLTLEKSLDEIYSSFNSNLKRKIKLSSKLNVKASQKFDINEFFDLYHKNLERLNLKNKPIYNLNSLKFLLNNCKKKLIYCAYINDKLCCSVVILYNQNYSEYLTSLSLKDHNHLTGFLLFESIKFLKSMNIKYFNLGGGVKNVNGIENFKKSFGFETIDQYQTKLILDEDSYLKETKNLSSEYFPKFINA